MSDYRYFTVSRWDGRPTFAIWTVNPITHAPAGERFEYVARLARDDGRSVAECAYGWGLGEAQGDAVPIPDKRMTRQP